MRFTFTHFLVFLYSFAQAQVYVPVDATSKVSFKIKNFGSNVEGRFRGLAGAIHFNASNPATARFDVTINTVTLDTGIGLRDHHLRKPDYFDVTDFPTIRFTSVKVEQSGQSNEAVVTGKLTIKKATKEISFPFRYREASGVLQLTGELKINRRDFGVGSSSFSLADELTVFLDVSASK